MITYYVYHETTLLSSGALARSLTHVGLREKDHGMPQLMQIPGCYGSRVVILTYSNMRSRKSAIRYVLSYTKYDI